MTVSAPMRDGKSPKKGTLFFTPAEWEAFVLGSRDGEFDIPEEYLSAEEAAVQRGEAGSEASWVPSPLNDPAVLAAHGFDTDEVPDTSG